MYRFSLAIRRGYVPEISQIANTKTEANSRLKIVVFPRLAPANNKGHQYVYYKLKKYAKRLEFVQKFARGFNNFLPPFLKIWSRFFAAF